MTDLTPFSSAYSRRNLTFRSNFPLASASGIFPSRNFSTAFSSVGGAGVAAVGGAGGCPVPAFEKGNCCAKVEATKARISAPAVRVFSGVGIMRILPPDALQPLFKSRRQLYMIGRSPFQAHTPSFNGSMILGLSMAGELTSRDTG